MLIFILDILFYKCQLKSFTYIDCESSILLIFGIYMSSFLDTSIPNIFPHFLSCLYNLLMT